MAERMEPSGLALKLGAFVVVAIFANLPLLYVVPIFAPLFPDNPAGMRAGILVTMFVLQFLLFVLFLGAARLLFCTTNALALLFMIDGLIVFAFYAPGDDQGAGQLSLIFPLIPMTVATTYFLYCYWRKLT